MPSTRFPVELRALVVSANGQETDLASIESALRHLGVSHDTIVATQTPLATHPLSHAGCGRYQAIFLTTGELIHLDADRQQWVSALDERDRAALADYQRLFGARLVVLYASPSPSWIEHGLVGDGVHDTSADPVQARLTELGREVFWYLNPQASVPLRGAHLYLGMVDGASTVPLLTTPDGHAVVSIRTASDGRQQMATTIANAPQLVHSLLLAHGIVNWAMRGLWIGSGVPNLSVQVDDVLIRNAVWDRSAASDATGQLYRATAEDVEALVAWQRQRRLRGGVSDDFRLELGFVGYGAEMAGPDDDLTPALTRHQAEFQWFNHTWDHLSLDHLSYDEAVREITRNDKFARDMGLTHYAPEALVQGDVSGLDNEDFLRAAAVCGIRMLVADSSRPGWAEVPSNVAVPSVHQPEVLVIPRHPTNLFCNVTTPEEWVGEYNHYYGTAGIWSDIGRDLTYAELLDSESDVLLRYLLHADNAPLMFHQANLRAYDGAHSLLTDLLDATLDKYAALVQLPATTHPFHVTAYRMAERGEAEAAAVTSVLDRDGVLTVQATADVVVTITGVAADHVDWYGGQPVSQVQLRAGVARSLVPAAHQPAS